jgi:hypothetical protein
MSYIKQFGIQCINERTSNYFCDTFSANYIIKACIELIIDILDLIIELVAFIYSTHGKMRFR